MRRILRQPAGAVGAAIVVLVVLLAVFAPLVAPYDPLLVNLSARLQPPSWQHLMGTDQTGRDILSRVLWGARPSLSVGVLAVAIGLLGGVAVGLTAGFLRGAWEQVAMRAMDALAAIPMLIWAIAIAGILGVGPVHLAGLTLPNEAKIVVLVGVLYIPPLARVTYSGALAESAADYVRARRMQGAAPLSIMFGDVLPNCLSPVIVQATLLVAVGIVVEASLSFVGLGVEPPAPSWGSMLADVRSAVLGNEWWIPLFPGLAISFSVIGVNLLGDALRDVLDPRRAAGGTAAAGLVA